MESRDEDNVTMSHTPVYKQEVTDALEVVPGKRYVDATYGEGGHSREMVARGGSVLAFDWDLRQVEKAQEQLNTKQLEVVHANFADIAIVSKDHGYDHVDGVLFDLGLSYEQLAESGKGLSYQKSDEELDMRLVEDAPHTAVEILRLYTIEQLYTMFANNSEIVQAQQLAQAIVETRKTYKIKTVGDLLTILDTIEADNHKKLYSQVFQALRIEVNDETDAIRRGLEGAKEIVKKGGKIVVITFQSREDRIVKLFGMNHKDSFAMDKIKKRDVQAFERSATVRVLTKLVD